MPVLHTTEPPYYAVVFTSVRREDTPAYDRMAEKMMEKARLQPGFLGVEHARDGLGITVSYWKDLESIRAWKQDLEHQEAQQKGKEAWYRSYRIRIALVTREYGGPEFS